MAFLRELFYPPTVAVVPVFSRRRRSFIFWLWSCVFVAILGVLSVFFSLSLWIYYPPKEEPYSSNAVMVIAGYDDGRHSLGADYIESGIAENFVVSNPAGTRDKVGSAYCRGIDRPSKVSHSWCVKPKPATTAGEAFAMGALAEEQGWSSATVVTGRTHARRVKTMFEECANLDVAVTYPDTVDTSRIRDQIIHEIGGYIKFWMTYPC